MSAPNPGPDVHDFISIAFAATLGLGTISASYFTRDEDPPIYKEEPQNTREKRRREREAVYYATMKNAVSAARAATFAFAFMDGIFNLADALKGATETGLLDASNGPVRYAYLMAIVLFGIGPTLLAVVISWTNSLVDRIPDDYSRHTSRKEMDLLRTFMGNLGLREYSSGDISALLDRTDEQEEEDEPVRRTRRTEPRSEAGQAILEYLQENSTATHVPSTMEIVEALGLRETQKSTVSENRSRFILNRDIWRA
jgi:hypothetical protein